MNTLGTENTPDNYGVDRDILCLDRRHTLQYDSDENTKRIDHRCRTLGLMARIDDGNSRLLCIVDDLSEKGVRITQIPSNFNETANLPGRIFPAQAFQKKKYLFGMIESHVNFMSGPFKVC